MPAYLLTCQLAFIQFHLPICIYLSICQFACPSVCLLAHQSIHFSLQLKTESFSTNQIFKPTKLTQADLAFTHLEVILAKEKHH
jgi:hypothetical protein